MPTDAFRWSDGPEPHGARTRALLKAHPEIRSLIGRNPWTGAIIVAIVALQVAVAAAVANAPWWMIVAAAWVLGAVANHALFVAVHECAHGLLYRNRWANNVAALVANFPQFVPSAISFRHYHLKHHAFQGVHELDADLPSAWEARLIRHYSVGKVLWLLAFPVFQVARTFRTREIRFLDGWVVLNWLTQAAFLGSVWWAFGPRAVAYFGLSLAFSIGLHPLGARWIQEHYLTFGDQETTSYYGAMNALAMNVGYHNEHHDFPSVPWHRLPAIRRAAPEVYDALRAHRSWTLLLLRFIFDQELSLFSRMLRRNRGGLAVRDDHRPDVESAPVGPS